VGLTHWKEDGAPPSEAAAAWTLSTLVMPRRMVLRDRANLRHSSLMTISKHATPRNLCFLFLVTLVCLGFWNDLANLVRFSFAKDVYSYIVLIPVVSVALIVRQKNEVFRKVGWALLPGMALMVAGLAGTVLQARFWPAGSLASLSAATSCFLALLTGIFTLCYGARVVRAAIFPILFLVLMIPIPGRLLDMVTVLLQRASLETTYRLMTLGGSPVLRNGFVLSLEAGSIQVAKQCSGIRSTLGLLIGSIVACHLFLRSAWKKVLIDVCVVPVSIFKNALRIVTLYWLGFHTDKHFLTGELHRYGGIPFSLVALGILGPLLWFLRRSEVKTAGVRAERQTCQGARAMPATGQILSD